MKRIFTGNIVYIGLGVLVVVIIIVAAYLLSFGKVYQKGISILNQKSPEEATLKKKKTVKKITFKKSGAANCMEITPDGVVRIYSKCGENLESADRPTDSKNILKLFKLVSENELGKYNQVENGEVYELTIETSEGSEKIYVVIGGNNSPPIGEIIQTIQNIQGDLSKATPSGEPSPQPSLSPGSSPGVMPSAHGEGSPLPGVTPGTGGSFEQPFVCGFSDTGSQTKPYRVSNVVCTDQPSPAP